MKTNHKKYALVTYINFATSLKSFIDYTNINVADKSDVTTTNNRGKSM